MRAITLLSIYSVLFMSFPNEQISCAEYLFGSGAHTHGSMAATPLQGSMPADVWL